MTPFLLALMSVASYGFTRILIRYALDKGVLDIPNSRSSHSIPTPRGGGLSFVAVYVVFVCAGSTWLGMSLRVLAGMVIGGSLIAVVGWCDDRKSLSVRTRVIVHFLSAALAVYCLGGLPEIRLGRDTIGLGALGSAAATLALVWSVNLYNFMDGIDGIAGTEGVMAGGTAGMLALLQGKIAFAYLCFGLASSVLGFLILNWQPAKIFMGDVGSGFLGFVVMYLAIWSERSGVLPMTTWVILFSVFLVDATLTLVRRMLSGERLYEPHRSHVYQLAVQAGHSHSQVTGVVALLDALLGVMALASLRDDRMVVPFLLSVGVSLMLLHWHLSRRWSLQRERGLSEGARMD
jgi:Fuc2NAc and GlcNAc transferase